MKIQDIPALKPDTLLALYAEGITPVELSALCDMAFENPDDLRALEKSGTKALIFAAKKRACFNLDILSAPSALAMGKCGASDMEMLAELA